MNIRPAVASDVPRLVEMGRHFHAQSIYAGEIQVDEAAVAQFLANAVASPLAVFLVADVDGVAVAGLCGVVSLHFLTGRNAASELFFWVEPEHRGAGARLLKAYEAKLRERGVTHSALIAPRGEDRVEMFYARLGYHKVESIFMKAF